MPVEKVCKMGIVFESLPEEVESEKDKQLIALLVSMLTDDQKSKIKNMLGEKYFQAKMRKVDKIIAIKENKGVIDISKNPGMTRPEIFVKND
jgi:hypothetical protein